VIFYGLADARLQEAVELYATRDQAIDALEQVLADEPTWERILSVVEIDLSGWNASPSPQ